jgi:hypothetical protein
VISCIKMQHEVASHCPFFRFSVLHSFYVTVPFCVPLSVLYPVSDTVHVLYLFPRPFYVAGSVLHLFLVRCVSYTVPVLYLSSSVFSLFSYFILSQTAVPEF